MKQVSEAIIYCFLFIMCHQKANARVYHLYFYENFCSV